MEVYIDTMEAQWRKDALVSIIDGINAESQLDGTGAPLKPVIRRLEFSDFAAGDMGIEFKEPGDFINSIRDKRLFDQAMGLRMNFAKPRIIVNCGYHQLFDEEIRRGFHENAIRGLIAALIHEYKVSVDFTGGRGKESFKQYMHYDLRKALSNRVIVPHLPVRPAADPKDHMRAILSCFPGIGEKKVDQIMGKYRSLKDFIENPARMLMVRGWGNATIRKIEAVINNERNEWWDSDAAPEDDDLPQPKPVGQPITTHTQRYTETYSMTTKPMGEMSEEERRREMMRY